jgi:4-amino-4-deoxy-L-arabinose transferase-like glycosyltransferase
MVAHQGHGCWVLGWLNLILFFQEARTHIQGLIWEWTQRTTVLCCVLFPHLLMGRSVLSIS